VNSSFVIGIGTILFALLLGTQTTELPAVAKRMPVLLIWLVVVLAAMMIVEEFLKWRNARRSAVIAPVDQDEVLLPVKWLVLVSFGAAIIAYVALIPIAGYLIVTPLFITGSLLVSRTMSALLAVAIGTLATAFIWAVFIWALNLPVAVLPILK